MRIGVGEWIREVRKTADRGQSVEKQAGQYRAGIRRIINMSSIGRPDRQFRPGKLYGDQGRPDRICDDAGSGGCPEGHYGKSPTSLGSADNRRLFGKTGNAALG